jgi:hypothetical protein
MGFDIRRGTLAAATGALALGLGGAPPAAQSPHGQHGGGIAAPRGNAAIADYDIVRASISIERDQAAFRIQVAGQAGATRPQATGSFAGSAVHAYVWPTTLDSGVVGFDAGEGILALAVTFHPDFDDGAPGRERNRDVWHSHWVVLGPDDACGPAALKVRDLPRDRHPRVPGDWPGVPLMLSSPNLPPALSGDVIEVRVPMADLPGLRQARFDGVTAGLRVNGDLHAPLLCVAQVFDVASGNLSLPGRVAPGGGTR